MANIIFNMESGLNDSIYGKVQAPIKTFIEKRAEAFEQTSVWEKLFKRQKSTHWAERITSMTAMDGPKPMGPENPNFPTDGYREGYSKEITHVVWKDQFSITREMLDDAQLIDAKRRPQAFVTAYYRRMEDFAAKMYATAFTGATSMDYEGFKFDLKTADGVALFNNAHTSITQPGYTQSNIFNNALTASNLGIIETRHQMFTDDDGNILNLAPDTIVIPNIQSLKEAAFVAIGSEKSPVDSSNAMNYQFGRWNIIVWPYLNKFVTGDNLPWMLVDSQYLDNFDAAVWFDRTGLEIESYKDRSTWANVWQMYFRFGAGFADWRAFSVGGIASASAAT